MNTVIKNLHLGLSTIIVCIVALVYGLNPNKILPLFFEFSVTNLELKNIFRAMMGLYIGFSIYWSIGIIKPTHWRNATISNIIFMGGLSFGRIISTFLDGISIQYTIGLILELIIIIWGIYNLKKES
ncbi:DUF4345 domain-containing protein [Aquimarina aquimarini]|uniref:DUF4345 domain-containing protein n=1 Tax=Aquimarina aquimarini TaxID=1191734 RepID=UPI000D5545CD|nr:DUF4345 domain-containing protein [Aquimarina aquimarini]